MMVVLFVTIWCRRVCACGFFFHSCASVFSFIVFLWLFLCIFMLNSDKQSSHRHHERKGRVAQCRTNSRMQSKRRLRWCVWCESERERERESSWKFVSNAAWLFVSPSHNPAALSLSLLFNNNTKLVFDAMNKVYGMMMMMMRLGCAYMLARVLHRRRRRRNMLSCMRARVCVFAGCHKQRWCCCCCYCKIFMMCVCASFLARSLLFFIFSPFWSLSSCRCLSLSRARARARSFIHTHTHTLAFNFFLIKTFD